MGAWPGENGCHCCVDGSSQNGAFRFVGGTTAYESPLLLINSGELNACVGASHDGRLLFIRHVHWPDTDSFPPRPSLVIGLYYKTRVHEARESEASLF